MQLVINGESDLIKALSWLFAASQETNIDDIIPIVETRTREFLARGMLDTDTMLWALEVFLYFRRSGISQVILRNLERREKSPVTVTLRSLLNGEGDQDQRMLQALYFIKHFRYDTKFVVKNSAAAAIADLPLAGYAAVLDAACGTGLAGPVLRAGGFTGRLIGVDISPHMIERARAKNCYDELSVGNVVDYFENCPGALDAILLIDVAPHLDFATLGRLIGLSHYLLRDDGALLLNAPIVSDRSTSLSSVHGLHRNSTAQIDRTLREAGFAVAWVDEEAILTRQFSCRRVARARRQPRPPPSRGAETRTAPA